MFAVKTRRLGETPMAHIVLADGNDPPGEAELIQYCSQHLAGYKTPEQFQWVDSLARTVSRKLIRNAEPPAPLPQGKGVERLPCVYVPCKMI